MLASHWIIEDLVEAARRKEWKELSSLCDKYSRKYPNDAELNAVAKDVAKHAKARNSRKLAECAKRIKELFEARKLEGHGGSELWFSDTRKKGEQAFR